MFPSQLPKLPLNELPQGFLPVLYAWFKARQSAAIQLTTISEDDIAKPQLQELRGWKMLLLWLPAACDLTGTTVCVVFFLPISGAWPNVSTMRQLMNVGLLYTPVSIYQMTRGALVLFVGVLSVIFLRRRLWFYQFSLLCLFFLPC